MKAGQLLSMMLALTMLISMAVPHCALAEDAPMSLDSASDGFPDRVDDGLEPEDSMGEDEAFAEAEVYAAAPDGRSNEVLFEGYFNRAVAGLRLGAAKRRRASTATQAGRDALAETSLTGTLALYDVIRTRISAVASGEATSTEFKINASEIGLADTWWTREELEMENLDDDQAVKNAMLAKAGISSSSLVYALLVDCPYDLYWYDKTTNPRVSYGMAFKALDGERIKAQLTYVRIRMAVAQDYAATGVTGTYEVNDLPLRVTAAVTRIGEIVSDNSALGDYDKLRAYADAICGLVAYNHDAVNTPDTPYGDPWQLVYIFDGDPETDVVCEGYSKAFKYLCDLSVFSEGTACVLVAGNMAYGTGAGPHMWNVVRMGDGRYYLVDITNSDGGDSSSFRLFMKGCVGGGSSYTCDGIVFTYNESTLSTYGAESPWLHVSDRDYGKGYAVTFDAAENGSTSADRETADAGGTVTLTLTPAAGYAAAPPTVLRGSRSIKVTDKGANRWSFTMPYGDVTVVPAFEVYDNPDCEIDENGVLTGYTGAGGDVVIPASVTGIGDYAFYGCTSLTSVTIPSSVTSIGDFAFFGCSSLASILIPDSVTGIGQNVFDDCSSLEVIRLQTCDSIGYNWAKEHMSCQVIANAHRQPIVNEAKEPTCTETGLTEGSSCAFCGDIIVAQEEVAALGHDLEHHDAKTATCTEAGWEAYDACSRCDYTTYEEIAALGHDLEHHDAKAATCTEAGWAAYDTCSRCDYSTYEEIAALGHDWGEPTYEWAADNRSVKATSVCQRNGDHILEVTVSSVSRVSKSPTDDEMGETTYIATFDDPRFAEQTMTLADIPALNDMSLLILPEHIDTIDDEAFSGIDCEGVIIPDGCTTIGSKAFADCAALVYVRIPASVTSFAADAFEGSDNVRLDYME